MARRTALQADMDMWTAIDKLCVDHWHNLAENVRENLTLCGNAERGLVPFAWETHNATKPFTDEPIDPYRGFVFVIKPE